MMQPLQSITSYSSSSAATDWLLCGLRTETIRPPRMTTSPEIEGAPVPSTMVPPVRMAPVVCVMLTPLRMNCSVDTDLLPAHQIDNLTMQKVNVCSVYLMDRECGVANLGMGKHSACHQ